MSCNFLNVTAISFIHEAIGEHNENTVESLGTTDKMQLLGENWSM